MIYVYDMTMNDKKLLSFKRYGATYKKEKKFLMGEKVFYSYTAPGMEKILVVPTFAEEYRELEAKLAKGKTGTDLVSCRKWLNKVGEVLDEEEYPSEDSDTGSMMVLTEAYRDIKVRFNFLNNMLIMEKEFEIAENNIFGNGIYVQMDSVPEEE